LKGCFDLKTLPSLLGMLERPICGCHGAWHKPCLPKVRLTAKGFQALSFARLASLSGWSTLSLQAWDPKLLVFVLHR
jgi:hypothetical protein